MLLSFCKKKVSIVRHVKAVCLTHLRTKFSPLNRKDKKCKTPSNNMTEYKLYHVFFILQIKIDTKLQYYLLKKQYYQIHLLKLWFKIRNFEHGFRNAVGFFDKFFAVANEPYFGTAWRESDCRNFCGDFCFGCAFTTDGN